MIYRLVTRNTFEGEMFARASKKLGLEQAILSTHDFNSETNADPSAGDRPDDDDAAAAAGPVDDKVSSPRAARRAFASVLPPLPAHQQATSN